MRDCKAYMREHMRAKRAGLTGRVSTPALAAVNHPESALTEDHIREIVRQELHGLTESVNTLLANVSAMLTGVNSLVNTTSHKVENARQNKVNSANEAVNDPANNRSATDKTNNVPETVSRLRAAGWGWTRIASLLNAQGVPTVSSVGKWHAKSLWKMYRR